MSEPTPDSTESVLFRIRRSILEADFRISEHAVMEMAADAIPVDEVVEVLSECRMLEEYPDHRRGPCCLVGGTTSRGRNLHVVCTSGDIRLVVITVYEPMPPKFPTPWIRKLS